MNQPGREFSGPSTVDVPSGSQALNHEKVETLPGLLRAATIRPPSAAATALYVSVSPASVTAGAAIRTFCAPSSEATQTSPLSM